MKDKVITNVIEINLFTLECPKWALPYFNLGTSTVKTRYISHKIKNKIE